MNSLLRQHKFWIWSLCIALLVARISGAHWHLCFDGSEPPAMLHAGDVAADHHTDAHHGDPHHLDGPHSDTHHSDIDLNVLDNGLLKLFGKNLIAAFAIASLFVLALPPLRSVAIPYRARIFPRTLPHNTPPSRGPPR